MDKFITYIKTKSKERLEEELKELYSSFESVRMHYHLKLKSEGIDSKVIRKYQTKISEALHPSSNWEGGLNTDKVERILSKFNSKSNLKYYFELSLYSLEECTKVANAYGGDYGEEFYNYFVELYQDLIGQIWKEGLENEYQIRLKRVMEKSFEGYGYKDDLMEIYVNYTQ